MRNARLALGVIVALGATTSHAGASEGFPVLGGCVVLTDPIGDVHLNVGPVDEGVTGLEKHVDVKNVRLLSTQNTLDIVVNDTELNAERRGTWLVSFTGGKTHFTARASLGEWASQSPPVMGFSVSVNGRRPVDVTGAYDVSSGQIAINVPYAVLGAAGRAGATLSRFSVDAEEVIAATTSPTTLPTTPPTVIQTVRLHDVGSSASVFRVGTCREPYVITITTHMKG